MKRPAWITLAIVIVLGVLSIVLWPHQDAPPSSALATTANTALEAVSTKATVETPTKLVSEDDEFNPYESEAFKANLRQVAEIYAENSKYPTTSQPVYDPSAVLEPEPFELTEVDLPFPKDNDDDQPIRIAVATDKYQYFQGDTLIARVQIKNAPSDTFIDVSGQLSGRNGDVPLPLNFEAIDGSLSDFTAQFDTQLAPPNLMTSEMLVKLNVKVDGRAMASTVAFRYDIASAQVVAALPTSVEGPNLLIPLQVNVAQSGYYFIQGVLEDAATGRPLIELQQEGRLQLGNGLLTLNAHIAALSRGGSEGPYRLRSVKLRRGAGVGESSDRPGSSAQRDFQVGGFPFSTYADEEYEDELARERADFLRDAGSLDDEQNQIE